MSSSAQDKIKAKRQAWLWNVLLGRVHSKMDRTCSPHENGNINQTYNRFIKRLLKDSQKKQDIEYRALYDRARYAISIYY